MPKREVVLVHSLTPSGKDRWTPQELFRSRFGKVKLRRLLTLTEFEAMLERYPETIVYGNPLVRQGEHSLATDTGGLKLCPTVPRKMLKVLERCAHTV